VPALNVAPNAQDRGGGASVYKLATQVV